MSVSTQTNIPLVDLRRQLASIREEVDQAIAASLDRADFVGGKAVSEFEAAFAQYSHTKHCVGVGNGTDALRLILWALDLQPGDEVITSPMTFIATAEILGPMGVKPVFADIDPNTYTLDPVLTQKVITSKTKAVMPVHLYGQPAQMDAFVALSKEHKLHLVEDAAQAHGAEFNGQRIGSFGTAAGFSFYPGKNLGAFGDGGAVTTNDPELAEKISRLANHGRLTKYEHLMEGSNSRLDTMQAAILSIKLKRLDDWNKKRQAIAARYNELLADISDVKLPALGDNRSHVYHLYVLQTPKRDKLLAYLHEKGIFAGLHYPIPLHLQPAYKHLGIKKGAFPHSEQLAEQCISLPIFPELTEAEVQEISTAVHKFFS